MANQTETGHAMNVTTFKKYIQFLETLGSTHNPVQGDITITSLNTLHADSKLAVDLVKLVEEDWKLDTNARELAFQGMEAFVTRILATLKTTDASQQNIDDLKALVTKFRGTNRRRKSVPSSSDGTLPEPPLESTRSISQQSYDQKLEHFSRMILLLKKLPGYAPNEVDLKINSLETTYNNLAALNLKVSDSAAKLKAARIARNTKLYGEGNGMLDLVKKSKDYIVSVYGKTSQQYKAAVAFKLIRVLPRSKAK